MEHLRASQLALAHLEDAHHGRVEALTAGSKGPLVIEDYHLTVGLGDHPRVHPSLGLGWLERTPRPEPGPLGSALHLLEQRGLAVGAAAVGKRGGVMELDVIVVEVHESLAVPLLDCANHC